ncbi:MAG: excinuclease ABC subunit UvrA [Thiotrichales bacterium]|nr:excinuclease ABC subunit UvrA [Thiotrichales bacterium]
MDFIHIRGARTHNLRGVDVDIPRDRLVVITGLSGSGKSSLAFDTIYAEGQRRYVESLSAYARQFLSVMEKPDVEHIEGLSPAISIEQKSTSHNPRSTVGTITEIHDYLRLLFARVGEPRCPDHGVPLEAQTVSQMVDAVMARPPGERLMLLAPVVDDRKGEHARVLEGLRSQGFIRARIDGRLHELDDPIALDAKRRHTIEAVVDRFRVREDLALRLAESFETALALSDGRAIVAPLDSVDGPDGPNGPNGTNGTNGDNHGKGEDTVFSARFACHVCGYAIPELEPRIFSFNNPAGACQHCDGLGVQTFFDPARIVAHPELSLPGGAVRGWDRRNVYYFQMIQSLAAHYGFDLDTPFHDLSPALRGVILNGSGTEAVRFTFRTERRGTYTRTHPFEGVIPNMERRYRDTESNVVRDELAKYLGTRPCASCGGARLNRGARNVFVAEETLPALAALPIRAAHAFFTAMDLGGARGAIASRILREIVQRLQFLVDVGLDYLSLDRAAETLSGGEAQRIRLASQIGAGLVGVTYILDEPSIGLHQRDNRRLLDTLEHLRDIGNTVIVVEHDEEAIESADHVIDMGPGAGVHGGGIVAQGPPADIAANPASLTGQYLSRRRAIEVPRERTRVDPLRLIRIVGARGNNLAGVDVEIPGGLMTCVTGVSGSGKSTLVNDTLYRAAARTLNNATDDAAPFDRIEGLETIDRVVDIDQSPIGRTPRSNPATYTGLFTPIRDLFAATPEARSRGYGPGRFSFNVRGGRCEACSGDGVVKVEMHFLPDIYVQCDVCAGKRFNRETLDIRYKGRTIHEVLEMTVEEARTVFDAVPMIARKLQTLIDVGLSYIRLGQRATTLSGGEAQRVKLARELSKRDTGRTLYILDEPTTGLHFHDTEQLLRVLHRLRDRGNTVVVIEHNLEVVKTADWIVDLGPEGGDGGGRIVVTGTPETVAACGVSHTGYHLSAMLCAPEVGESRQAM